MKTITLKYTKHPPVKMPIKAEFDLCGFTFCVHRPAYYYGHNGTITISKNSWTCSEKESGQSIPLAGRNGAMPTTIKGAKCRAIERLNDRLDQIGEAEFKSIIQGAQKAPYQN